jgi:hypothetical protein
MIRSLTPPQAAGNALAFAVQTMGRVGALPGWGDGLNRAVSGIFLEETKCTRLAIVADFRRDHCIGGLILGGSKLPLTLHAGDAPGVFRSGTRPGSARTLPCALCCVEPDAAVSLPFW